MTLREEKPDVLDSRSRPLPHRDPNGFSNIKNSSEVSDVYGRFSTTEEHVDEVPVTASRMAGCVFERQDSLARAACLQECDRVRDAQGILNFLETTMNIEDYLEDITQLTGISADDIELDDIELQKCNILYTEGKDQTYDVVHAYDPFAHSDAIMNEQLVHSECGAEQCGASAEAVEAPAPPASQPVVKEEPEWDGTTPSSSIPHLPRRGTRSVQLTESSDCSQYTPTTTARKYRLKTPQERNNLSYKVKRQRNNDAVRKSRTKAKQLQLMKDKQLEDALNEIAHLKTELNVLRERLSLCRCKQ